MCYTHGSLRLATRMHASQDLVLADVTCQHQDVLILFLSTPFNVPAGSQP